MTLQTEYCPDGTLQHTLKTIPNNRAPMNDNGVDYTNAQAWMFACRW